MSCKNVFVKISAKRVLMLLLFLLSVSNVVAITCVEARENRSSVIKAEQSLNSEKSVMQRFAVSQAERVRPAADKDKVAP